MHPRALLVEHGHNCQNSGREGADVQTFYKNHNGMCTQANAIGLALVSGDALRSKMAKMRNQ